MQSEIIGEPEFPQLRTNQDGLILLMSSPAEGTVVFSPSAEYIIGYHYTYWEDEDFTPFSATIQLKN